MLPPSQQLILTLITLMAAVSILTATSAIFVLEVAVLMTTMQSQSSVFTPPKMGRVCHISEKSSCEDDKIHFFNQSQEVGISMSCGLVST